MNKGIIFGVAIAIIIGISAVLISGNDSENVNEVALDEEISEISLDEEISEISLDEEIKNEPKQYTVGLTEDIGFTEG